MGELPAWLKHATVWALLALGLFLGVHAWQARARATMFTVEGGTLEIRRGADGHYHWPGRVGGQEVDFLIDTGATSTAIPIALARELGLPAVDHIQSHTAGGVVSAAVVLGDIVLDGGVRAQRLRMTALPDLGSPLLGMDVLGKLRWAQSSGVLRIDMQGAAR